MTQPEPIPAETVLALVRTVLTSAIDMPEPLRLGLEIISECPADELYGLIVGGPEEYGSSFEEWLKS